MNKICAFMLFFFLTILTHLPSLTNAKHKSKHHHQHHHRSPAYVPSGTHAILTVNDFARGGDGGGAAECDGKFHPLPQRVVALSSGWYNHGVRCGRMIKIKARNGRSTVAKVVDECDSSHGCKNNIVDASETVWKDLRLNTDDGEVPVSWIML
ncbi:ripening-related protein grip22-like [Vigna umbellata]|uniref:Kiwellin Kissper KiTH-3 KiTH-1 KiTH-2 n=2 Tax=Phaseolus angularis TaxID=3914 RepID=A0A0L9VBI0_PHAAN|nr:ripening-related protein grip22-like [Vigna umbellata]XP_047168710.1 ripening-related protein grip22-like [Vigna umbellata]XP_052730422.1 ripening-related protein grip22-like [Vigna angularis]KAG2401976.1 Kiwellin Kissper KiTH-3 KiTH-1 KiTH-2 [Vigna angularis]KOM52426.1 hypothetical protein LR48_Vigan09g108500 [Vigna angularis]